MAMNQTLNSQVSMTDCPYLNPTSKPVSMMRYFIEKFTQPGDVVLEVLAGLGPASEAAILEGRHAVALVMSPQFVI